MLYFLLVWLVLLIAKPKSWMQFNFQVGISCLIITFLTSGTHPTSRAIITAVISSCVIYAILWLFYRKDFVKPSDEMTSLSLRNDVPPSSGLGQPPFGRYVNHNNTTEYIDLKPDGTFYVHERSSSVSGRFEMADSLLTMILPNGQRAKARMLDNAFTDGDGKTWERQP